MRSAIPLLFLLPACLANGQMQRHSRFVSFGPGGYPNDLLQMESAVQPSPICRIALNYAFTDRFVTGLGFSAGPRYASDSVISVSLNAHLLARRYFDLSAAYDYPTCFVELAGRTGTILTDAESFGYDAVGIGFGQTWRTKRSGPSREEVREAPFGKRLALRRDRALSRFGLEYSLGADVIFTNSVTLLRPMVQVSLVGFFDDLYWKPHPRKG